MNTTPIAQVPIGLAHLTLLDVAPPSLVEIAAESGYQAVGIRIHPVHPAEDGWPMLGDAPMLKETMQALRNTGMEVWDFETIKVGPDFDLDDFRDVFEAGALLGGKYVNVFPADPELERLMDSIAQLGDLAAQYEVMPLVEPMVYNAVPSMGKGLELLQQFPSGRLGLTLDALHFHRYGGTPQEIRALPDNTVQMFQICDGPWDAPTHIDVPGALPRNQSSDAPPLALEGRAFRRLPGDGDLPLEEYVSALPSSVRISVEAPSYAKQSQLTPAEIAAEALEKTHAVLRNVER